MLVALHFFFDGSVLNTVSRGKDETSIALYLQFDNLIDNFQLYEENMNDGRAAD